MYTDPKKPMLYSLCRTSLTVTLYIVFLTQLTDFYFQVIRDPTFDNSLYQSFGDQRRRKTIVTIFFVANLILRLIGLAVICVENLFQTIVYTFVGIIVLYLNSCYFPIDLYFCIDLFITFGSVLMSYLIYEDNKPKPRIGFTQKLKDF